MAWVAGQFDWPLQGAENLFFGHIFCERRLRFLFLVPVNELCVRLNRQAHNRWKELPGVTLRVQAFSGRQNVVDSFTPSSSIQVGGSEAGNYNIF